MRLGGALELGWDTIVGGAVIGGAAWRRKRSGRAAVPEWLYGASATEAAGELADLSRAARREKMQLLLTTALLLTAPLFFSWAVGPVVEGLLYALAVAGVPLTQVRMAPARMLLGQAALYVALCKLISSRHPDFFSRRWVRWSLRGPWLLPVLGGYAASLAVFNVVDPINQALLPQLDLAPEGMVAQLANPADRSAATLLLGAITPIIGAPVFEELQCRAFILQALTATMSVRGALLLSGFIFGAQHLQLSLVLPLSAMGYVWAVLYTGSKNLLVPVAIHALWNARIFIGSYLGL